MRKSPSRGRDLTGQTFGRLVARARNRDVTKPGTWWDCVCECGTAHTARADNLTQGLVQSCGCLRRDEGVRKALAMRHKASARTNASHRIADALRSVFPEPPDFVHVDRPGARVVRGSKY